MKPFSLVISHTPWRPERRACLFDMLQSLLPLSRGVPFLLNQADYRGQDWQQAKVDWALSQWDWSAQQEARHHVFLTDDLHVAPGFWDVLEAMLCACPDRPVGLLSNHPEGPDLVVQQHRWYRTNSWIVGPAYVLPHDFLVAFLEWFRALPDGPHTEVGTKAYRNDDSSLNEFVTLSGSWTAHPLPTIIEHRNDLESTVGHGDKYTRERVSWRARRHVVENGERFEWVTTGAGFDLEAMRDPTYWGSAALAPLLKVGV